MNKSRTLPKPQHPLPSSPPKSRFAGRQKTHPSSPSDQDPQPSLPSLSDLDPLMLNTKLPAWPSITFTEEIRTLPHVFQNQKKRDLYTAINGAKKTLQKFWIQKDDYLAKCRTRVSTYLQHEENVNKNPMTINHEGYNHVTAQ